MALLALVGWLLLLLPQVSSLFVVPNSPCLPQCDAGKNTGADSLLCTDRDFFNSDKGTLFRDCTTCESRSLFYNGTRSDQYWFLFHMKYTLEYCLFELSPPTDSINACAEACAPLSSTLKILWLGSQPWKEQYEYCTQLSNSYTENGPRCAQCLQSQEGAVILGNFVDTMVNACQDRAYASKSMTVATRRAVYATSTIAISTTSTGSVPANPTTSSPSGTQLQPSSSSNSAQATNQAFNSTDAQRGLSSGAVAGIGVACALVGAAIFGLAIWFILRKRRDATHELPANQVVSGAVKQEYREVNQTYSPSELNSYDPQHPYTPLSKVPLVEMPAR